MVASLIAPRFGWLCGTLPLLVMTAAGLLHAGGNSTKGVTIATIIDAWSKRERLAKTLDVVAVGTEFRPQAKFSLRLLAMMGRPKESEEISLPDTSFPVRLRLAIDGNGRARLDYKGKAPAPTNNGYPEEHVIDIWDHGDSRTIFPVAGAFVFPSAHISKARAPRPVLNQQALPLRIVFRPFDRQVGVFDPSKLELTKDKGVVDDRPCLVVTQGEKAVWVDPAMDYVPTRYLERAKGRICLRIDIKYRDSGDPRQGWVPTSWQRVSPSTYGDEAKGQESVRMVVTECKLGQPISNDVFQVEYPPGTWVRDYVKHESYIIRKDGTRRIVLKSEEGMDYDDLLRSGNRRWFWPGAMAVALLVMIVAASYWSLRRRRWSQLTEG